MKEINRVDTVQQEFDTQDKALIAAFFGIFELSGVRWKDFKLMFQSKLWEKLKASDLSFDRGSEAGSNGE